MNKKTIDSEPVNHYNEGRWFSEPLKRKRGLFMCAYLHHYTISFNSTIEDILKKVKAEHYDNVSYNEMMKDLISRGLAVAERKDVIETDVLHV